MRRQVAELFDAVSRTEKELHRIEVSYDQEIKLVAMKVKCEDADIPVNTGNKSMVLPLQAINGV